MVASIGSEPRSVLDCGNDLGESVLWDGRSGRLWWVNIHQREIWSWSPGEADAPAVHRVRERVGAIGLCEGEGLVVAFETGFARFDPSTGAVRPVAEVEADRPTTRLNDGRVDPAGRFVCGGMDEASPQRALSAVYALDAKDAVRALIPEVSCANSIAWSPDGRTLYFTDMPSRRIDAFDYDPESGAVAGRRLFADLGREPGWADGSTVDAEGFLWNAQWGGSKLVRYAPDGTIDREVRLPVSNPTCLAFGGPDLDILFLTSARFGLTAERRAAEPEAGNLFAFRPGVGGRSEHRFGG